MAGERVLMHLECGAAVLEVVAFVDRAERQLARLAGDRQADAKAVGDGSADNEAARLDAEHEIDLAEPRCGDLIDHGGKAARVTDERRDVAEEDAGLREVGNVTN